MAATAPQDLLTGGSCFSCYGASAVQMMRLSLLSNLLTALDSTAMTDPQTLITEGACYNCYGASLVDMMELALLDQISINISGGGGGGSNTNDGGVVDPEGVVSAVQWARYYNSANATDWVRTSPGTGNTGWQQVS